MAASLFTRASNSAMVPVPRIRYGRHVGFRASGVSERLVSNNTVKSCATTAPFGQAPDIASNTRGSTGVVAWGSDPMNPMNPMNAMNAMNPINPINPIKPIRPTPPKP